MGYNPPAYNALSFLLEEYTAPSYTALQWILSAGAEVSESYNLAIYAGRGLTRSGDSVADMILSKYVPSDVSYGVRIEKWIRSNSTLAIMREFLRAQDAVLPSSIVQGRPLNSVLVVSTLQGVPVDGILALLRDLLSPSDSALTVSAFSACEKDALCQAAHTHNAPLDMLFQGGLGAIRLGDLMMSSVREHILSRDLSFWAGVAQAHTPDALLTVSALISVGGDTALRIAQALLRTGTVHLQSALLRALPADSFINILIRQASPLDTLLSIPTVQIRMTDSVLQGGIEQSISESVLYQVSSLSVETVDHILQGIVLSTAGTDTFLALSLSALSLSDSVLSVPRMLSTQSDVTTPIHLTTTQSIDHILQSGRGLSQQRNTLIGVTRDSELPRDSVFSVTRELNISGDMTLPAHLLLSTIADIYVQVAQELISSTDASYRVSIMKQQSADTYLFPLITALALVDTCTALSLLKPEYIVYHRYDRLTFAVKPMTPTFYDNLVWEIEFQRAFNTALRAVTLKSVAYDVRFPASAEHEQSSNTFLQLVLTRVQRADSIEWILITQRGGADTQVLIPNQFRTLTHQDVLIQHNVQKVLQGDGAYLVVRGRRSRIAISWRVFQALLSHGDVIYKVGRYVPKSEQLPTQIMMALRAGGLEHLLTQGELYTLLARGACEVLTRETVLQELKREMGVLCNP